MTKQLSSSPAYGLCTTMVDEPQFENHCFSTWMLYWYLYSLVYSQPILLCTIYGHTPKDNLEISASGNRINYASFTQIE